MLAILIAMLVLFSVIVFVIPFYKGGTFWIAYLAEIIAVAAQIPVFKIAYDHAHDLKSKVLGFPVFRVGYIYLCVQTAVSVILFILGGIFIKMPFWIALVLCLVILTFAFVGSIATDIAHEEVEKIEFAAEKQTSLMKRLRADSSILPGLTNDIGLKKSLEKLSEQFRYSDPVSAPELKQIETEIAGELEDLRKAVNQGDASAYRRVSALEQRLNERNALCKQYKNSVRK